MGSVSVELIVRKVQGGGTTNINNPFIPMFTPLKGGVLKIVLSLQLSVHTYKYRRLLGALVVQWVQCWPAVLADDSLRQISSLS